MKSFFHLILWILPAITVLAQEAKLDSLKAELKQAKSDTGKISILIDLAYESPSKSEEQLAYAVQAYNLGRTVESVKHKSRSELVLGVFYSHIDLDSAITLMKQGTDRYLKNELFKYATNAYLITGITFELENMLDTAISFYTKAYELGKKHQALPYYANAAYALANINSIRGKNVDALMWAKRAKEAYEKGGLTQEVSHALNQIGIIYDQKGLYSEALDNYLRARDLAVEAEDVNGEILITNNIGVIYDNMNDSEQAMKYFSDALEKSRIHNMADNEATLLNNLSYIHLKNGDTTKSMQLLKRALEIDLESTFPCFKSYPLEGVGSIMVAQNNLDSAAYFLNKALVTSEECEDVVVIATVYKDIGQLLAKKQKPAEAEVKLIKSLKIAEEAKLQLETKESLYALYEFYKQTKNKDKALAYLEKYQALSDSINKQNNIEKAAQLAAEYEFRKQVAKMEQERLQSEQRYTEEIEAKISQNRLILLALVLFILLAGTLARFYFVVKGRNQKLRWLNDEKNKLMGVVAHDLRNPLNMIIGLIPLIEDATNKTKDKNLAKYVELLGMSAERMRDMIDRVLDISAIENMKVNLKLERTNLTTLTYDSIHNFDMIAAQKNIKIVDNIDRSKELFSEVDPNYLVQVIDNLLSNAIKFSEKGKQIEVSLISHDDHHELIVRDEGPGISDEEQKNLFKAFTTLSSKPTGQERSTGLGLSIAYKFIKAMGAEIACHSKPGEGSTFKLVFKKA